PPDDAAAGDDDSRELSDGEGAESFLCLSPEVAGGRRVSAPACDGDEVGVVLAGFFGDSSHAAPSTISPMMMLAGVALLLPLVRLPIRWPSEPARRQKETDKRRMA
ncbi:MAG: hypothetical protein ACK58T_40090, partial [Phycisphaerae bacterium]